MILIYGFLKLIFAIILHHIAYSLLHKYNPAKHSWSLSLNEDETKKHTKNYKTFDFTCRYIYPFIIFSLSYILDSYVFFVVSLLLITLDSIRGGGSSDSIINKTKSGDADKRYKNNTKTTYYGPAEYQYMTRKSMLTIYLLLVLKILIYKFL